MRTIRGDNLNQVAQTAALSKYVHRYTMDHVPQWVRQAEVSYPVQFSGDKDWLANTFFHVTKEGYLDERYSHCESNPTWPNNPELRQGTSQV